MTSLTNEEEKAYEIYDALPISDKESMRNTGPSNCFVQGFLAAKKIYEPQWVVTGEDGIRPADTNEGWCFVTGMGANKPWVDVLYWDCDAWLGEDGSVDHFYLIAYAAIHLPAPYKGESK